MHERIQQIIDNTANWLGLDAYYLKRHSFSKNIEGKICYVVTMEWFPNGKAETDDGLNPPGTAVVDVEVESEQIKSILFVEDISYAKREELSNLYQNSEKIIEWIEELTGLEFGKQFQLIHETADTMRFRAAIDNIPIYPEGTIEVSFNQNGQLTTFYIDGVFPKQEEVEWEPFSLTPANYKPIAKQQCKLLEIPMEDLQAWKKIFGIATVFIMNRNQEVLPYEIVEDYYPCTTLNKILTWQGETEQPISLTPIGVTMEITETEALTAEAISELEPISKPIISKASQEIKLLLQQELPDESGKWKITSIKREPYFLIATLNLVESSNRFIQPRLKVILDVNTIKVLNYVDNRFLLTIFEDFSAAKPPIISRDIAFEKLSNQIEVTPVYVYHQELERYLLCGKVACRYGVDAVSEKMIDLGEPLYSFGNT
ncbi:hypothetical protein [Virgibacillus proomii]|uniref:hypothetical protein n=1 Tax=Virgibacillus proomii TaxID=84407 RepID=UPI001C121109|nr:hypothetical protein [Virgibacillus proomii]MBU5266627.1 hypothetical protein [Virgibacillus proomii]